MFFLQTQGPCGCELYAQMTEEQKDFLNTITNNNIEARTIADLESSQSVQSRHIAEAIGYRNLDRDSWFE